MNAIEIEEKAKAFALAVIEELSIEGLFLVDVEYVTENKENYLRVFIDKPGGVTIDDCVAVTNPMNEILDREEFISSQYIFEVSSPGLTRPFKGDEDFERNIGNKIEVKLFAPMENTKLFTGELLSASKDSIVINADGKEIEISRDKIALVNKAIEF